VRVLSRRAKDPKHMREAHTITVQPILHGLGGREPELFGSRDLDRLAGRGISALMGGAILYLEFARTIDRHFGTPGCPIGDRGKDAVDDLTGFSLVLTATSAWSSAARHRLARRRIADWYVRLAPPSRTWAHEQARPSPGFLLAFAAR